MVRPKRSLANVDSYVLRRRSRSLTGALEYEDPRSSPEWGVVCLRVLGRDAFPFVTLGSVGGTMAEWERSLLGNRFES